jgi:hypothetical protein
MKLIADKVIARKNLTDEERLSVENKGILLASGLVAGEALTGVLLASLVIMNLELPRFTDNPVIGLIVFPIIAFVLISIPLRSLIRKT